MCVCTTHFEVGPSNLQELALSLILTMWVSDSNAGLQAWQHHLSLVERSTGVANT